jgi:hypothetical protein
MLRMSRKLLVHEEESHSGPVPNHHYNFYCFNRIKKLLESNQTDPDEGESKKSVEDRDDLIFELIKSLSFLPFIDYVAAHTTQLSLANFLLHVRIQFFEYPCLQSALHLFPTFALMVYQSEKG